MEVRSDLPALADEELRTVELSRWEESDDIDQAGDVAFTVRLVNELDGLDELLHTGVMTAVALDEAKRFAVDYDWLLGLGLVALDTYGDTDGPKLRVTVVCKGDVGTWDMAAHLFHDGKRVKQASHVGGGHSFTRNDGTSIGEEVFAEFDDVRGWNNLADEGWGSDDWHLLDAHDGHCEVKFTPGGDHPGGGLRRRRRARWRVVGHKFDAEGRRLDSTEVQGEGSSSSLAAYKPF